MIAAIITGKILHISKGIHMPEKKDSEDDLKGDLERKSIHIITGLAYIPLILYYNEIAFEILLSLEILFLIIFLSFAGLRRIRYAPVMDIIKRWGREKEDYVPLKATLLLNTGFLITFMLFSPNIVYASIAITALGDGIATISGKLIGKHKLPYSEKKTIEGSLVGATAAFLGASLFISPVLALVGSLGSIILESVIDRDIKTTSTSKKIINLLKNDNLLMPVFSGMLIFVSGKIMIS